MKTLFTILILLLLAMGGGYYYQFYYPPNAAKRQVAEALQQFAAAVETQDRAKVGQTLDALLTDDATVRLNVEILAISHPTGQKPIVQDFTKPEFIQFIDNILYTVTDWHYTPKLTSFEYRKGSAPMPVTFTSSERGEGTSYYAGVKVLAQFSTITSCTGQTVFVGGTPRLSQASCDVGLRMLPKANANGSQSLFDNDAVRGMLKQGEAP